MNKFEFIATGKITKKISYVEKEEQTCFVIESSFVVSFRQEMERQPIKTFDRVVDLIPSLETSATFTLSIPSSMGFELFEKIKILPCVIFKDRKFWVHAYSFTDDLYEVKQTWNLECKC